MKGVQRFGVKRKLAPRYVGPYRIIERKGNVAYKLQLLEEMSAIFFVFHVSQLKKCLRIPEERVETRNIKLASNLVHEEKNQFRFWIVRKEKLEVNRSSYIKCSGAIMTREMQPRRPKHTYETFTPIFIKMVSNPKSQDKILISGGGL
jgi:hypothetical protein